MKKPRKISHLKERMVRSRRLELPRVAPLAPQASASTVPPRPHKSGIHDRRRGVAEPVRREKAERLGTRQSEIGSQKGTFGLPAFDLRFQMPSPSNPVW